VKGACFYRVSRRVICLCEYPFQRLNGVVENEIPLKEPQPGKGSPRAFPAISETQRNIVRYASIHRLFATFFLFIP